ncbi:MAG TPA: AIR carboxylase family protein [Tepidisphaeraceae bacterium]|jgi:5-(carboxyamino)imidazole ribonucleotide mutase
MAATSPFVVAILAESAEAQEDLRHTRDTLDRFGVAFLERATETGRSTLRDTVSAFEAAGASVFIVADTANPAGTLSAAVSGLTLRPVLAVPMQTPPAPALDALLATTRGGGGPPVASLAIGKAGAINAALLAVAILANADDTLRRKLDDFRAQQTANVLADRLE